MVPRMKNPVAKFESLWPPGLSHGGRRWVLANLHDGILDEVAVQLDLDVNPTARSAEVVSAHGTMRYHDATVSYFRGLALHHKRRVCKTAWTDRTACATAPRGFAHAVKPTSAPLHTLRSASDTVILTRPTIWLSCAA